MADVARERVRAWAQLLAGCEIEERASAPTIADSHGECQLARATIAGALGALDRAALAGGPRNGIAREWVACLDEILSIADRACTMLRASKASEQGGPLWAVWERNPTA
jgi:hypothetical protein